MPRARKRTDADENFALNLRAVRTALGWSVDRLAREANACREGLGLNGSGVWKSEMQGRNVAVGEALALCAALGVDLAAMVAEVSAVTVASQVTLR